MSHTSEPKDNFDIGTNKSAAGNTPIVKTESFDLTGLLLDYLSHWGVFLLSIIICGAAAYYYCKTQIPTYTVSASIYLNDENSSTKSNAVTMGSESPMVKLKQYIDETEIEILKSRNNLIKIVDSLNLSYSYYREGKLRDVPVYRTAPIEVSLDSLSLKHLSAPIELTISPENNGIAVKASTNVNDEEECIEKLFAKLPGKIQMGAGTITISRSPLVSQLDGVYKATIANSLTINFADNSYTILRIRINTPLVEQGVDIINTLLALYNQRIIEDKNRSALQTEAFIIDRLVNINDELHDVEEKLKRYREEHNIADIDAQTTMNLTQRSSSEQQISQVDAQMSVLNDVEHRVKRQDNFEMLPTVSDDPAVSAAIQSYNTMVSNYDHALQTQTRETGYVRELENKLNQQKSQILDNIASARGSLRATRRSIASLDSRSAGQLAAQPSIDKGLQEIFREQQVKVNIYTFLLQKREEIALQKTLATPTAQLIDNPSGSGPVSPKHLTILAIGLLIGFLIPALIILARRIISPKFKDQVELERMTSVPVIGEICHSDDKENIVIGDQVATPIAELFRLLRNNISFIPGGADNKVILLTSAVSGEGKTFVSLNLAMTYALTGKRVVVLGLDIRRPVLAHLVGLRNSRGITTYLSEQEDDINSLIFPTSNSENLFVMPAGPVPPNPNELLLSKRMDTLIAYLRQHFDYIIMDTSPIGIISDTYILIPQSDIQLYVTRAFYSTKRSLRVLHNAINNGRLKHPYIVLNNVNMTSSAYSYRHYGYYGYSSRHTYGYGYGYGYSRDDKGNVVASHHHHKHSKKCWFKRSKK